MPFACCSDGGGGVGGSSGEMLYPARFHYHHNGTLGKKLWQLNVSDVDLQ